MRYFDCFTFATELDILEMRFKTLYDKVEKFVLVEADRTHSGKHKDLLYLENESRFRPFMDKVVHVAAHLPSHPDRWVLENYQRNCIVDGFEKLGVLYPGDYVLISDVDEIPDLTKHETENQTSGEGVFQQKHSYYFLDRVHPHIWNGTVCVRMARFFSPYGRMKPQDCRNARDILYRTGLGWHLGWMDDPIKKIESFGHSELDTEEFKSTRFKQLYNERRHPSDEMQLELCADYLPPCARDYQHLFDDGRHLD